MLAFAAVGFVVLLFVGQRMVPGIRARLWLGWLLALVALYVVQRTVTTEREHIRAALDRVIEAVATKDMDRFDLLVAPGYADDDFDRNSFLAWLRRRLETIDVYDAIVHQCVMTVAGDSAEMQLTATATIRYQGSPIGRPRGVWTLSWIRGSAGWQISAIRPISLGDRPINSVREIR